MGRGKEGLGRESGRVEREEGRKGKTGRGRRTEEIGREGKEEGRNGGIRAG